jgi:hypothetical protein
MSAQLRPIDRSTKPSGFCGSGAIGQVGGAHAAGLSARRPVVQGLREIGGPTGTRDIAAEKA